MCFTFIRILDEGFFSFIGPNSSLWLYSGRRGHHITTFPSLGMSPVWKWLLALVVPTQQVYGSKAFTSQGGCFTRDCVGIYSPM